MASASSTSIGSCGCTQLNWLDFPQLRDVLPGKYDYKLCEWREHNDSGFTATLRLTEMSGMEMKQWKEELEDQTQTTFRVSRTYPNCGVKILFKESYHCQHSGRKISEKSKKFTGCLAKMNLTVKRCVKYSTSKDTHLPLYPSVIMINWQHNHSLRAASALRYRDVPKATQEELMKMFEKGHSPSTALDMYKCNLQISLGEKYVFAAVDRSNVPDLSYVYRLYQKQYHKLSGKACGTDLSKCLNKMTDTQKGREFRAAEGPVSQEMQNEEEIVQNASSTEEEVTQIIPSKNEDEDMVVENTQSVISQNIETAEIFQEWDDFCQCMKSRTLSNHESLLPAMKAGKKLKSNASLVSALRSLGKYPGCTTNSKHIGTQPTTIARRQLRQKGKRNNKK